MILQIIKNLYFSFFNVMIVAFPGFWLFKFVESYVGKSNLLIAVFAIAGLAGLILNKLIVDYQLDRQIGYWEGWKLGLIDAKNYLYLFLGK